MNLSVFLSDGLSSSFKNLELLHGDSVYRHYSGIKIILYRLLDVHKKMYLSFLKREIPFFLTVFRVPFQNF